MTRKDEDVSQITAAHSPIQVESSPMSPSADVVEMSDICTELADRLADGSREKDRVGALTFHLGFGWNRALEFLRGKARRVDSWEKDHARRILEELREAELRQQAESHVNWLRSTVEHLRTTDEEFHQFDVDGLERALSRVGARGGALGGARAAGE